MKIRQWLILLSGILIIWSLASLGIDNSIILPTPSEVLTQMTEQMQDIKLYESLAMTFFRVLFSAKFLKCFAFS